MLASLDVYNLALLIQFVHNRHTSNMLHNTLPFRRCQYTSIEKFSIYCPLQLNFHEGDKNNVPVTAREHNVPPTKRKFSFFWPLKMKTSYEYKHKDGAQHSVNRFHRVNIYIWAFRRGNLRCVLFCWQITSARFGQCWPFYSAHRGEQADQQESIALLFSSIEMTIKKADWRTHSALFNRNEKVRRHQCMHACLSFKLIGMLMGVSTEIF